MEGEGKKRRTLWEREVHWFRTQPKARVHPDAKCKNIFIVITAKWKSQTHALDFIPPSASIWINRCLFGLVMASICQCGEGRRGTIDLWVVVWFGGFGMLLLTEWVVEQSETKTKRMMDVSVTKLYLMLSRRAVPQLAEKAIVPLLGNSHLVVNANLLMQNITVTSSVSVLFRLKIDRHKMLKIKTLHHRCIRCLLWGDAWLCFTFLQSFSKAEEHGLLLCDCKPWKSGSDLVDS